MGHKNRKNEIVKNTPENHDFKPKSGKPHESDTHFKAANFGVKIDPKILLIFVELCGRFLATAVCQIRHTSRAESLFLKKLCNFGALPVVPGICQKARTSNTE